MSQRIGIVAVAPGPPLDERTFSGGSRGLLSALARRGSLIGATSGALPRPAELALAAAYYSRDRQRWHQRRRLNAPRRFGMSRLAARRLSRLAGQPDAVLQIGAFYDLGERLRPRVRCSYHDGNFAVALTRRIGPIDPSTAFARRTFAAERRTYDGLDLIMVMSDWLRASFIESFGQPEDKVVTVGAGANVRIPHEAPSRPPGAPPRFLFVGKDFERKGGPAVLAAFERVRADLPGAELVIVGPTRAPRVGEGVVFEGFVSRSEPGGEERIASLYEQASAFVMPSLYEPFGFVFLEAMGYGLPCIGSDVCAMPEIISDGRTGYVVPPGDVEALAERMLALGRDPETAAEMGLRGREHMLDRFTWDAVAARVEEEIRARLPDPLEGIDLAGAGVVQ